MASTSSGTDSSPGPPPAAGTRVPLPDAAMQLIIEGLGRSISNVRLASKQLLQLADGLPGVVWAKCKLLLENDATWAPLPYKVPSQAFAHMVVTSSAFCGPDRVKRKAIKDLVQLLGGQCSDNFVFMTCTHLTCTHLIVPYINWDNFKCLCAAQFNIPMVPVGWLVSSARAGMPLPLDVDFQLQTNALEALLLVQQGVKCCAPLQALLQQAPLVAKRLFLSTVRASDAIKQHTSCCLLACLGSEEPLVVEVAAMCVPSLWDAVAQALDPSPSQAQQEIDSMIQSLELVNRLL